MEKLFCMQVAAQLTIAAANGIGGGTPRPIDPTLQDPNQRAVDLEVWEIFRAYYMAVQKALGDNTAWPAPNIPPGSLVPSVLSAGIQTALQALAPQLTSGPVGAIINNLLKSIPAPASIPGNLPNPGSSETKS